VPSADPFFNIPTTTVTTAENAPPQQGQTSNFLPDNHIESDLPKKRKRRKARPVFSKGQVNRLIDDAIHPLKELDWSFTVLDETLHKINEGDIQQSVIKFVEYTLPEILKKFLKKP